MPKVVFGMTMSLDGYFNDSRGSVARLYPNLGLLQQTELLLLGGGQKLFEASDLDLV